MKKLTRETCPFLFKRDTCREVCTYYRYCKKEIATPLCPKAPFCLTQHNARKLPLPHICYTKDYHACWLYPQITIPSPFLDIPPLPLPPIPPMLPEEITPEYDVNGNKLWGYEIHPERSKSGESCLRCKALNGVSFSGGYIPRKFEHYTFINRYRIRVNLHPNCNCELWLLVSVEYE